jgi:hypothetical protein
MILIYDPNYDPRLMVHAEKMLKVDVVALGYIYLTLNTMSLFLLKDLSDMELDRLAKILKSEIHFRRDAPLMP